MTAYYILEKLNLPVLFFIAWRLRKGRFFYYFQSSPFLQHPRIQSLLAALGVIPVPFEQFSGYDPFGLIKITAHCSETVAGGIEASGLLPLFRPLFHSTDEKDLAILVNAVASSAAGRLARLLDVALHLRAAGQRAHILMAYDPLSRFIQKQVRYPVPILGGAALIAAQGIQAGYRVALLCVRRLLGWVGSAKAARKESRSTCPPSTAHDCAVLYFPHKGVQYGQLFLKDHYYSTEEGNPFHPKNILHVESVAGISSAEKDTIRAYYEKEGFPFTFKPGWRAYLKHSAPRFILFCLRKALRLAFMSGAGWGARLCLLWGAYAQYASDYAFLEQQTKGRIALVGYDYLFPKSMSLALKSRAITVVSVQERFMQAFLPSASYIFDYYFIISSYAGTKLAERKYMNINHVIPVGGMRYDLLHDFIQKRATLKTRHGLTGSSRVVLVLDFHSLRTKTENQTSPFVNWRNNKAFYKDIDRLAAQNLDTFFVIRGKNADWCAVEELSDVRDSLRTKPNVLISTDYSRLNISYELAAISDLVIARHTSLADECLAAGIPVLFHDYAPTVSSIMEGVFDYGGFPLFCHSYEELGEKMETFFSGRNILASEEGVRFRKWLYGHYFDGQVHRRLHACLQDIFKGSLVGATCE